MKRPFIPLKECKPWLTFGKTLEVTKYSETFGELNTGGDVHYRVKNTEQKNAKKNRRMLKYVKAKVSSSNAARSKHQSSGKDGYG